MCGRRVICGALKALSLVDECAQYHRVAPCYSRHYPFRGIQSLAVNSGRRVLPRDTIAAMLSPRPDSRAVQVSAMSVPLLVDCAFALVSSVLEPLHRLATVQYFQQDRSSATSCTFFLCFLWQVRQISFLPRHLRGRPQQRHFKRNALDLFPLPGLFRFVRCTNRSAIS